MNATQMIDATLGRPAETAGCEPQGRQAVEAPTLLEQFERLAHALYAVRRLCPTLPVLAIQWMHPKHPVHPCQEALMDAAERGAPVTATGKRFRGLMRALRTFLVLLARLGVCVLHAIALSLKLVWLRVHLRHVLRRLSSQRFDLIATTWCFGTARAADDRDFYYGSLQRRLDERGVRMLLLCGDARRTNWRAFAVAQTSTSALCRLPALSLVPPLAPVRVLLRQLSAVWRLHRLAGQADLEPLVRRVSALAREGCMSRTTLQNSLFYWIGWNAVRRWHPRAFMSLYEGHGWERCAWWGARKADRSCRIVGYQHTLLFRDSLALLDPQVDGPERLFPDLVLSAGRVACELVRQRHERLGSRVLLFGSLRHEEVLGEGPADPRQRTVLVVPEGISAETQTLFSFAYACAKRLPTYTFIVRSHPEIPMGKALRMVAGNVAEVPNIVISTGRQIEEDMRRSSVVMYRGSSLVVPAVLAGLRPIYVSCRHLVDSDPLHLLSAWRQWCATPDELARCLASHAAVSAGVREAEWRRAVRFVRECLLPVEDGGITEFLDALGLGGQTATR